MFEYITFEIFYVIIRNGGKHERDSLLKKFINNEYLEKIF